MKSFLEKIVSWGTILAFLVAPIIYFGGRASPYITSKTFFLMGLIEVVGVCWVWLLIKDRKYRITRTQLVAFLPMFVFLVLLTISSIAGVDPANSFFSNVESGTGMIFLWHLFVMVLVIASMVRVQGMSFVKKILQATLVASVILAIETIFIHYGILATTPILKHSGGGGAMGNKLLTGAYLIFGLFAGLILFFRSQGIARRVVYGIGILIILLCPIYFTHPGIIGWARVATLSLLGGIILAAVIACILAQKKWLRMLGWLGMVGAVCGLILFSLSALHPDSRISRAFVSESGNRIIFWQEAVQGIKAKPILGWGQENFRVVHQTYFNPVLLSPQNGDEAWTLHPHGGFLEILVNGGMLAGLAYLGILIGFAVLVIRLVRRGTISSGSAALVTGMMVAYLVQAQMIYDSPTSLLMFFSVIAILVGLYDPYVMTKKTEKYKANPWWEVALAVGVTIVAIPLWVFLVVLPAQKTIEMKQVSEQAINVRPNNYAHLFGSPGSYFLRTDPSFYSDSLLGSYSAQRSDLVSDVQARSDASHDAGALLDVLDPQLGSASRNYHEVLSLMQVENLKVFLAGTISTQDYSRMQRYVAMGTRLSPNDPQWYTAYATFLFAAGNDPLGTRMLEKALALNPDYQQAQVLKASLSPTYQ